MTLHSGWRALALDSPLVERPRTLAPAPVMGKLELLPFDLLTWENFERIQWRVMRDVEGLRHAQLYGDLGQRQHGLDIVALSPDETGVALQSKRYKRFGVTELGAAVNKFRRSKRPFPVGRLIIGVSSSVKSTQAVEALAQHRKELGPLQLDLWDQQELSRILRSAPEIVVEFFGLQTAEAFCLPFVMQSVVVPSPDAVAVREALARTPEEAVGAAALFRDADAASGDAERALWLVEEAQQKLRAAGFGAHAAQHEAQRSRLLTSLGRGKEAGRQVLEEVWAALDRGLSTTAELSARRLHEISQESKDREVAALAEVADMAIDLYVNPIGYVPDPAKLQLGDMVDQVRLAALAGETALANDNQGWLVAALPLLSSLATPPDGDPVLRTRLRILIAEVNDDWAPLLEDARKLKLGHELLSLVTARYARHSAKNEKFEEADALWDEAAGDASLAQRWSDASRWIFSRRAFRARWRPFTSNELLPLETALSEMGPSSPIVPISRSSSDSALESLRNEKLRPAAIYAQRALRDAVVSSDWAGEERSRRTLAAVYAASDELERAAHHLARAGDTAAIKELGRTHTKQFIDVIDMLEASNYWTVGTAYRLIAKQADLIPDRAVSRIADLAVGELTGAETGALRDLRGFATSRYQGAAAAISGIADRLTDDQADAVLSHFERQPTVTANHYRYHDEDEATAVARIAESHTDLRDRAVKHLVALLARSQGARNSTTERVVDKFFITARAHLDALASAGDDWALESIAVRHPRETPKSMVNSALSRLVTPLVHTPGVYTVGNGSVGDSLLVQALPSKVLNGVVAELLQRADDPHVGSLDRGEYLVAAANLARRLSKTSRRDHFATAMRLAASPSASELDEDEARFTHKLGGFRITQSLDGTRGRAVFLAACLASEVGQRAQVKDHAYALLGSGDGSDYWSTRALQQLGDAIDKDLGFLVGQGWAVRSLVCLRWVKLGVPTYLGERLAQDDDVRVRRTLARALFEEPGESYPEAREILGQDPSHSVRAALRGDDA